MRFAWVGLLCVGVVSRLAPLFDQGGRMLRQFPTEDGYLMLTMSRNLATGLGLSIADGEIPTNGTQPLATFLYAIGFWVVGGDRNAGVLLAQCLDFGIACAAAWLLYRLGRRVFDRDEGEMAAFAAALWFASPLVVAHSMNTLETGLYSLTVLAVVVYLSNLVRGSAEFTPLLRWAGLGALLGVAFWARNDAVLLCAALGLPHLFGVLGGPGRTLLRRVQELSVAAATTIAVALPWLTYNLVGFGHLVPISGRSESLRAEFGDNLALLPAKLVEYLLLVLPIPAPLERSTLVVVVGGLLVTAVALAALRLAVRSQDADRRCLLWVGTGYTLGLAGFYGLFFGAGHFMSRYLLPASVFTWLLTVAATVWLLARLPERTARFARVTAALVALCLAAGLNGLLYAKGREHGHFQVVAWVSENVPEEAWVGASQTGTLGFFHDRTINLDGKVNPEALVARDEQWIPRYILERDIQYIADWHGVSKWADLPDLKPHFDVLVKDRERNLDVLRRRGAPTKHGAHSRTSTGLH